MGCGSFSSSSFASYSASKGMSYDTTTKRAKASSVNQVYTQTRLHESLRPLNIIRECANNDEHPNTVPVILALDVTGSMGEACKETAEALGVIMSDVLEKFKDVEFCVMGIGDLDYDHAPIQMSQFESDIRIATSLDKVWMEHGGGPNKYESYTAAWYMGSRHTKLDCLEQGRKGIIITMGDEPLNPVLPKDELSAVTGDTLQSDVETKDLYNEVIEHFDVFHIAIDSPHDAYRYTKEQIKKTFGEYLGSRLKISTINDLSRTITECIQESIDGTKQKPLNENSTSSSSDGISW